VIESLDRNIAVSLEENIRSLLEEFSVDKSTIFEGFNFASQPPPELIERFIEEVVRDSVGGTASDGTRGTARPIVELLFATYRDHPQPEDVRGKIAIAVMTEAILRTPGATPQDFVIAAKKMGLLPGNCDNFVKSLVKQVHELKNNIYTDAHVRVTKTGRDAMRALAQAFQDMKALPASYCATVHDIKGVLPSKLPQSTLPSPQPSAALRSNAKKVACEI